MSVNRVTLLGRLGKDPEIRYTPGGQAVCTLSVATTEKWKDKKSGSMKESTEWHKVAAWGPLGENCAQYLAKGREVYVEGKLQTKSYEKDGVKRYSTEIVAQAVHFVGGSGKPKQEAPKEAPQDDSIPDEDNVPF